MSKTRLYVTWSCMKNRCLCETSTVYSYYGGRGIEVCAEWRDSFIVFRDWALANGYTDDLQLDRKDTNGNYEPDNCRWATRSEQMRNTRKRRNATTSRFKGVSKHSQNGCWVAQLSQPGHTSYIGSFGSEVEAANAYDAMARKVFGEFAHTNFQEGR